MSFEKIKKCYLIAFSVAVLLLVGLRMPWIENAVQSDRFDGFRGTREFPVVLPWNVIKAGYRRLNK